MTQHYEELVTIAPLKIIAHKSCEKLGEKINDYIVNMRKNQNNTISSNSLAHLGYDADNYLVKTICPRFGSGEAKAQIEETVRGVDLYIIADVTNCTDTYVINGKGNMYSPDDIFQDLKRIIAACNGRPHRISVIMPFLYESRQHRRTARESLDCAIALQELASMGVENIITFDAHDPRVQNAIPIKGFDNFFTAYQFIEALVNTEKDIKINNEHFMIISPDEGGMTRGVYYSSVLGVDMGMFYKRRDYSVIVDGKNPIVEHQFLGASVAGKDVYIIDDMIASGESMLDVARELKKRNARRVYLAATFGLFTAGMEVFDKAYNEGIFNRIFTTNLVKVKDETLAKPYYTKVDLSQYIALIIDTLNHDTSIDEIIDYTSLIQEIVKQHSN